MDSSAGGTPRRTPRLLSGDAFSVIKGTKLKMGQPKVVQTTAISLPFFISHRTEGRAKAQLILSLSELCEGKAIHRITHRYTRVNHPDGKVCAFLCVLCILCAKKQCEPQSKASYALRTHAPCVRTSQVIHVRKKIGRTVSGSPDFIVVTKLN